MSELVEKVKNTKELLDTAAYSHEKLITAKSLFPFKFFGDTITIDREQVTIVNRSGFRTADVATLKLSDILNVEHTVGPILGSIKIYSQYMTEGSRSIDKLPRADAQRVHRFLQGFLIAEEKGIDCSKVPKKELVILLSDLGKPVEV